MSSGKIRIELRYDAIKDKDIIDFIDRNGSTRAGFIKSLILQYKNTMGSNALSFNQEEVQPLEQGNKSSDKPKINKRKVPKLGQSFSSKNI